MPQESPRGSPFGARGISSSQNPFSNPSYAPDSLNFGKHIKKISKKVAKQLDVLCRLKNILSFRTKLCLYNSFIMCHFHYCSSIWHHRQSDSKKLDRLHKRALRYLEPEIRRYFIFFFLLLCFFARELAQERKKLTPDTFI